MEVPGKGPGNMCKGFMAMEEPGVHLKNMSKGFVPMEEPGLDPANISQELLSMEVPEALCYMSKGKTMIPSNALEVRRHLLSFI